MSVCLYPVQRRYDSRHGCADNKAKDHINSEAGGGSCSDPEHSLDGDGQQHHETAAVPSETVRERETG